MPPKCAINPFNADVAPFEHTPMTGVPTTPHARTPALATEPTAPRVRTPATRALTDCTPAAHIPTAPAPVPPGNPVTPPQPALPKRAITPLNDDVAPCVVSPVPMRPLSGQPAMPSHLDRMPPSPTMPIDPVPIDPASVLPKLDPIAPVSTAPPTAHGPRDFSALRSGTRNPWSSLGQRGRRSYRAHPRRTYLGPQPHMNSPSKLPHLYHSVPAPSYQLNSQFQSQHSEPLQYSFQPHSYSCPPRTEPPANIFQIIQHPQGISSTKPKITKNMPSYPILSVDTQQHTRASHCACGAILPVYRPDRGSWRLMDSGRGRFRRRFSRRSCRRYWDRECGRSHFRGGYME